MISLITVNYKTADYLAQLLETVFRYLPHDPFEMLVVENDSGDDLRDLAKAYPRARFIHAERNLGFAGGCNLGAKHARGETLLFINPDVAFLDDAITPLLQHLAKEDQIGVAGVKLVNADGSLQPSVRRLPTPMNQLVLLLKLHHLFPSLMRSWMNEEFDYGTPADVDQVMGAFFCVPRSVFETLGGFDERFFMWYEEVDFCKRVKDAGLRVRYYADIQVQHRGGGSFDRELTSKKQAMLRSSVKWYVRKHFGVLWGTIFRLLSPVFRIASSAASLVKPQ